MQYLCSLLCTQNLFIIFQNNAELSFVSVVLCCATGGGEIYGHHLRTMVWQRCAVRTMHKGDKQLKELLKLVTRNKEELDATLTEKRKETLEKFEENMNEMHGISGEHYIGQTL